MKLYILINKNYKNNDNNNDKNDNQFLLMILNLSFC
jgi:hypothetical protein